MRGQLRVKRLLIFHGRADRIRTCDPFTPSEVRYQTALRPDSERKRKVA